MSGELVVVTGAGKGIGREVALEFAREGAIVAICARTTEGLKTVKIEIEENGGRVFASVCDVGDEAQVKGFIKGLSEVAGKINVLVNNAGVAFLGPVSDSETSKWEETISVNLTGAFLVTKHALSLMERGSHIFNLVSIASKTGFPNWSAYCASKFGLLGFTNSLREELRGMGIKVTAVLPGPTDTPLWDGLPGDWDRKRMIEAKDVAKMIVNIYRQPKETLTEEVVILPTSGAF